MPTILLMFSETFIAYNSVTSWQISSIKKFKTLAHWLRINLDFCARFRDLSFFPLMEMELKRLEKVRPEVYPLGWIVTVIICVPCHAKTQTLLCNTGDKFNPQNWQAFLYRVGAQQIFYIPSLSITTTTTTAVLCVRTKV